MTAPASFTLLTLLTSLTSLTRLRHREAAPCRAALRVKGVPV
jgi:hypothetical protein